MNKKQNNSKQATKLNKNLKNQIYTKLYPNPIHMLNTCWNYQSCTLYDKWRDGGKLTLDKFFKIVDEESHMIHVGTVQGAHLYPSSLASDKGINEINNHFGCKLCWNCHKTFDFWGDNGSNIRVNEDNEAFIKQFKFKLLMSVCEVNKYYGM